MGIAHIMSQLMGQGIVRYAVAIGYAECPICKTGSRAVCHHVGNAAVATPVVDDERHHIGLVLVPQCVDLIHEAIAFAAETYQIGIDVARFRIGDFGSANQPELHGDLAVSVGLIRQIDAHGDQCVHGS